MSEKLGKWYPSDLDGGIHYCEAKKQQSKQEPPKQQLKNLLEAQLLLEGLDARVKKLERIVVDPRK